MDIPVAVTAITSIITIIVTGVCALILVNQKTLRDSRDDQGKRIEILERERAADREVLLARDATILACQATIEARDEQILSIGKIVTGEVHLVGIEDLLSHHHEQAVEIWQAQANRFQHVELLMESLATLMTELVELSRDGEV